MPYTPTTWVNNTTPLDATNMNHIELGLQGAAATAEAAIPKAISGVATDKVPVYNGSAWVAQKIVNAQIDPAAAIDYSKLSGVAKAVGYGTSLPGSPSDGDEYILVDSTSAPTYQWRFRYNSSEATYKWEFVGGLPGFSAVETAESTTSATPVDLTTAGPSFVVPRTGQYLIEAQFLVGNPAGTNWIWGNSNVYDNGSALSSPINALGWAHPSVQYAVGYDKKINVVTSGHTLKIKYWLQTGPDAATFLYRHLTVTPVKVS